MNPKISPQKLETLRKKTEHQITSSFYSIIIKIIQILQQKMQPTTITEQICSFVVHNVNNRRIHLYDKDVGLHTYISGTRDFHEIFHALFKAEAWNFMEFSQLDELIRSLHEDSRIFDENEVEEIKALVDVHQEKLSGYLATTKIIEFIEKKGHGLLDRHRSLQTSDYDELTVKLDVEFTEVTLKYISDLWKSLKYLNLPPHQAILYQIMIGSVRVTWLISKQLTSAVVRKSRETKEFFKNSEIVTVMISGRCIYNASADETFQLEQKVNLLHDVNIAHIKLSFNLIALYVQEANDLRAAACEGDMEVLKFLLDSGIDVNNPLNVCQILYLFLSLIVYTTYSQKDGELFILLREKGMNRWLNCC